MADAAETSKLFEYVGNDSYLVNLSPAVPENEMVGAGIYDPITATGDDSVERVITNVQYTVRPSLYYAAQSNAVEQHRTDSANYYFEYHTDMDSWSLMQIAFPGMSLSVPTDGTMSRIVEFGQNGFMVDGTFDVGTIHELDLTSGGTTQVDGISFDANAEAYLVITEVGGDGGTLTLGTFAGVDVNNAGIYKINTGNAAAAGVNLVASNLTTGDSFKGWIVAGPRATVD